MRRPRSGPDISIEELDRLAQLGDAELRELHNTDPAVWSETVAWLYDPAHRARRIAAEVKRRTDPATPAPGESSQDVIERQVAAAKAGTAGAIQQRARDACRALLPATQPPEPQRAVADGMTRITSISKADFDTVLRIVGRAISLSITDLEAKIQTRLAAVEGLTARCTQLETRMAKTDERFDAQKRHLRNLESKISGGRTERSDGAER